MDNAVSKLYRPRLLAAADPRVAAGRCVRIVAPTGYGKTTLLRGVAGMLNRADAPGVAIYVSLKACEGHLGLVVDALVAAMARLRPAARTLGLADARGADGTGLVPALVAAAAATADAPLTVLLDDVEMLGAGDPLSRLVQGLYEWTGPELALVLAGSDLGGALAGARGSLMTTGDLAATTDDIVRCLADHGALQSQIAPLAQRIYSQAAGWPAVTQLICSTVATDPAGADDFLDGLTSDPDGLVRGVIDHQLAPLRPETQYFAKVAATLGRFDLALVEGMFSADVPGTPDARRRLIQLPISGLPVLADALVAAHILSGPDAEGDSESGGERGGGTKRGVLSFNPMFQAALSGRFQTDDPGGYAEANRRAAEVLLARGDSAVSTWLDAFDFLLAAGELERLLGLLEAKAEEVFDAGYSVRLRRWLDGLNAHYGQLPCWVDYYLGRVLALHSEWDGARRHLDRVRQALTDDASLGGGDRWRWQTRLAVGYGHMLWQRGSHSEARTWCQRGLDALTQAARRDQIGAQDQRASSYLRLQLVEIIARLTMEVGSHGRAVETLNEALAVAESGGHVGRVPLLLSFLMLSGGRAGDLDLLEAVWKRAEPKVTESGAELARVKGFMNANRALGWMMEGRIEAALELARQSVGELRSRGIVGPLIRALVVLGRVLDATGDDSAAKDALDEAVSLSSAGARDEVRAEALLRAAAHLARGPGADGPMDTDVDDAAELEQARAWHDEAATLVASVLRMDGYLTGLYNEVTAAIRLRREKVPGRGIRYLEVARESYARFGANWDVARLHWLQAEAHHLQVMDGQDDMQPLAIEHLDAACAIGSAMGYRFGNEDRLRSLSLVGARFGDEETVEFCRGVLERLGALPDLECGADAPITGRYQSVRVGGLGSAPWLITTRSGLQTLSEEAYVSLKAAPGQSLVVLAEEQVVLNYGARLDLGQKRVMLPLLLHFLRHPETLFTMAQLAQSIWDADDINKSIQTKVKVAVSRLRSLLGKARSYVVTTRAEEDGASVVAYQLAEGLNYAIVERPGNAGL